MSHPRLDEIDEYWAAQFGCQAADLKRPGTWVISDERAHPFRIPMLERAETTLLRATPEHSEPLTAWIAARDPHSPPLAESLGLAFPDFECRVSPSEKVLYLDPATFRPRMHPFARALTEADSDALTRLHHGCSSEEQQAGDVCIDHPAIFGAFAGEQLVAAASFIDRGETLTDVGVLVHRDFRWQGYGRAAVSALSQWGLDHQQIVQYCRLCSNAGSARLADSLGFEEYARLLVVSLGPAL